MVEKLEDLNIPTAVVGRLIKEALPSNASVSKEARIAITRAASVFIIYVTTSATASARKENHKMITGKNILDALEKMELESFIEPLKDELENYKKGIKEKRENKLKKDSTEKATKHSEDDVATPNDKDLDEDCEVEDEN